MDYRLEVLVVPVADVEIARELRHLLGTLAARAPHPAHVRLAHSDERLYMESGDEPATDESDAESLRHSTLIRVSISAWLTPSFFMAASGHPCQSGLKTLPS